MSCTNCNKRLSQREISYGTGLCDACYDVAPGLVRTCTFCSAALNAAEISFGKNICQVCYNLRRKVEPCKSCKKQLTALEKSYGTGVCNTCYDSKSLDVPLTPTCSRCGATFAAGDEHAVRGICSSCRSAAMEVILPQTVTAVIPLDELVFYLETGIMPSNCRVAPNIYGRFQAYPSAWGAADTAKHRVLPMDRPTTFVLGPDGIEALIGKQGFDMLMAVGLTKKHVTSVINRKKKYGLVLFEAQEGTHLNPIAADWDGVEAVVRTHYPAVWDAMKVSMPLLRRLSYKQIVASGKDTSSVWYKSGMSPSAAFLRSSRTVFDARVWLTYELFCCKPYSGNGWTYSDEGERGVREFFFPNVTVNSLKSWQYIDIPVSISDKALCPLPAWWSPQAENLFLHDLKPGKEYNTILSRLHQTLPRAKVAGIQRVQNKHLYQKYEHERKQLTDWHGSPPTELQLFHGTSGASPDLVYNSETGFDMRFCTSGMWGVATYFAVNASYSDSYSYRTGNQQQMFLAHVLVGDAHQCPSNGSLRMPPAKTTQARGVVRYDSVKGQTGGSDVYMIYCNGRAYPSYLITYTV